MIRDVACFQKGGGTHCKIVGKILRFASITLLRRYKGEFVKKMFCPLEKATLVPSGHKKNWEAIFLLLITHSLTLVSHFYLRESSRRLGSFQDTLKERTQQSGRRQEELVK